MESIWLREAKRSAFFLSFKCFSSYIGRISALLGGVECVLPLQKRPYMSQVSLALDILKISNSYFFP